MAQDGARQGIIAQIALKPELLVGFHGIGAVILELVGAQFVHQADATAFLVLVNNDAAALSGNLPERDIELSPAIAPQTVKDVSGQALRVDSQQRRRPIIHVAHGQHYGLFDTTACPSLKAINAEQSVLSWKAGFRGLG